MQILATVANIRWQCDHDLCYTRSDIDFCIIPIFTTNSLTLQLYFYTRTAIPRLQMSLRLFHVIRIPMSSVASVSFWAAHLMRRRRRFRLPADLTSPSMPSCMSLFCSDACHCILFSYLSLYFAQQHVTVFCFSSTLQEHPAFARTQPGVFPSIKHSSVLKTSHSCQTS